MDQNQWQKINKNQCNLLAERSVSRTAARLNLTQSAISYALAKLRNQLGDPLLVKSGNKMKPTQRTLASETPLREALAALESAGAVRRRHRDRRNSHRRRRVFRFYQSAESAEPTDESIARELLKRLIESCLRFQELGISLVQPGLVGCHGFSGETQHALDLGRLGAADSDAGEHHVFSR